MRRCLAIAGVYPPFGGAGAVRQVKLFRHLRAAGWQVDVIAPRGRAGWHRDPELAEEAKEIPVLRVGPPGSTAVERLRAVAKDPGRQGGGAGLLRRAAGWARNLRDILALPDEMLTWAAAATIAARRRLACGQYDAVFTSSPPYSAHLVGLALRRAGGPGWLAEHRDPWSGHRFRAHGASWRRALDHHLEAAVLGAADAVTVISPGIEADLHRRFGIGDEVTVVTNGYDAADFLPAGATAASRFELLYVGTFDSRLTPPDPFLRALTRVLAVAPELSDRLLFRVLGGADLESSARLQQWMSDDHRHRAMVQIEGFVGHHQATHAMGSAGALALSLAEGTPWVLTSKVFEYLASHRPILAAVPPGDCRALLQHCGGAAIVDPSDSEGLATCLRQLVAGAGDVVSPRCSSAIAEYEYGFVARQIAELLVSVSRR